MISSLFVLLLQPVVVAAEEPAPVAAEAPVEAAAPVAEAPAPLLLPKTTPLIIAIDKEIGSKISQAGEFFPIRLVQAVVVDGVELLPAGIRGEGQVVHAKKAGMAGSAGELVLAARYLDHGGRRIELRSFRFIEEGDEILSRGTDNIGLASATNIFAGPLGFFIGGGNTTIAPGTVATAKTRNDEAFDRPGTVPDNAQDHSEEGNP